MRFLVGLGLVLALVWSAWWGTAQYGMNQAITLWLDDRRAEGWQADVGGVAMGGYPSTLRAELSDIALADPGSGVAVQMDPLVIEASALWPGDARVIMPETPIAFFAPDGRGSLVTTQSEMALKLHPGTALELESVAWVSEAWALRDAAQSVFEGTAFALEMTQSEDPAHYDMSLRAPGFAPGEALRQRLRVPPEWPLAFDVLTADATMAFDRPWDRSAIEQQRPQPREIDLRLAEATWGDMRLALAAALEIDGSGVPTGTIDLQARNWRTMLDLAQNAGLLPVEWRGQAEWGMQSLASSSGNADSIDVSLTLSGGFVRLGLIPIGPAPRLVLR